MARLSLLAFAGFAVADWVAVSRGSKSLEYVAKPATLAALVLYAASSPAPSGWLTAALVFSLLGDVFLMLPVDLFAAGLGAFLIGHLAYIGGFDASGISRVLWSIVVLAASSPIWLRIMRAVDQAALRPAVGGYIVVLAVMLASAIASGSGIAIVGAALFFASDGMLAWNRFVRPFPWAGLGVIITYHLGQLGLATALWRG